MPCSFFFSMIRRPPRSTPFPTRRSSDLGQGVVQQTLPANAAIAGEEHDADAAGAEGQFLATRSEEHTSELQSLAYLVCRLLLEKKKNDPLCRRLGRCRRRGVLGDRPWRP